MAGVLLTVCSYYYVYLYISVWFLLVFIDQTGTIYFFNQSTGESQWEKPLRDNDNDDIDDNDGDDTEITDLVYDIQKLVSCMMLFVCVIWLLFS